MQAAQSRVGKVLSNWLMRPPMEGVRSTMVMPLMKDGMLWGLISAMHHSGPRHIPYEARMAAEFLAHMLSLLMAAKEDAEGAEQRFYSMSARIRAQRNAYYETLEYTQKGACDITAWQEWFLRCLLRAIEGSHDTLGTVLTKARFWERFAKEPLNDRQIKVLNRVLDGFEGKLTSSKWAKLAKCSQDTAYRDILDLIERGALEKDPGGGRSTSYSIVPG